MAYSSIFHSGIFSAPRNTCCKVTRSVISIALRRVLFDFAEIWYSFITGDTLQMFKVKGQRSRSQRKVMYQQQNAIIRQWRGPATSVLAWASQLMQKMNGSAFGGLKLQCIAIDTFASFSSDGDALLTSVGGQATILLPPANYMWRVMFSVTSVRS